MPVQLELSYLLDKNQREDLFNSYLPVRIPITGSVNFMTQYVLNAQAAQAVMGIRVQETARGKLLHFMRLANPGGLSFPDQTQPNLQFKRIIMRIQSDITDTQGRQVDYWTSYDIEEGRCKVVQEDTLPQQKWLALVIPQNGSFQLLHFRPDPADPGGGGDPCVLAGCTDPNRTIITAIACKCTGCG